MARQYMGADGTWISEVTTNEFMGANGAWINETQAAAPTITGPLIGGSHLLTNGPLIDGRLIQ